MRSRPTAAARAAFAGLALFIGGGAGCTVHHRLDPVTIEPTISPSRTAAHRIRALCTAMVGPEADRLAIAIVPGDVPHASGSPGRLAVTWGLLEKLPEPEVAAAVAHELGRLIREGELALPAALAGPEQTATSLDADRTAVRLLRTAGYGEEALSQLLARLIEDPALAPETRQHLLLRFGRLVGS